MSLLQCLDGLLRASGAQGRDRFYGGKECGKKRVHGPAGHGDSVVMRRLWCAGFADRCRDGGGRKVGRSNSSTDEFRLAIKREQDHEHEKC